MIPYLRIDLTDNCNIRCIMCLGHATQKLSEMTALNFEAFREHTRGLLRESQYIQLGNVAEPTIHPRFGDFVSYIRSESDAKIHVTTNGTLLRRYAGVLNEARCQVQVSMDSLIPERYERIRYGARLDSVLKGLELLDTSRCKVLLACTLMRSNIDEYEEMVSFCQRHGFSLSVFPMILRIEGGTVNTALVEECLWFDKPRLSRWLEKHYGQKYLGTVRGAATGTGQTGPTLESCTAHRTSLLMFADGRCNLCFKLTIGNIHESSLQDIWHSKEAEDFRDEVDKTRLPCQVCSYRTHCLAANLARLENHVSAQIWEELPEDVREDLLFDSPLSDQEQKALFLDTLREHHLLYAIREKESEVFAIPEGVEDGPDSQLRQHPLVLISDNHAALYERLQKLNPLSPTAPPKLIGCYRGYNVVDYRGQFFAVALRLGVLDLPYETRLDRDGIESAMTYEALTSRLDQLPLGDVSPRAIVNNLLGYHWLEWGGFLFAVPASLGHINLLDPDKRKMPGILSAPMPSAVPSVEALLEHMRQVHTSRATT